MVAAALAVTALMVPAAAASTGTFKAQFQGDHGLIQGYGVVTTTIEITGFGPGSNDCPDSVTGIRVVTLRSDPSSTLTFALDGLLCDPLVAGTWTIVDGTGIFSGATGMGTITGVLNFRMDVVQYRGTITIP
jgi:hypothetical protein